MSKYLWFFVIGMSYLSADTLDKKKILEIIKAAKQHKTISKTTTPMESTKIVMPESEPIIVYRRKEIPVVYRKREAKTETKSKHLIYGSLPTLAPSSIELQQRFQTEAKIEKKEILFTQPQKNVKTGMNTEAIKIEYDE